MKWGQVQKEVDRFIAKHRKNRISSWSKVLAFANHERDVIYDSRTAVSLNVIFDDIKTKHRFFIPPTRVVKLKPTIKHLETSLRETSRLPHKSRYREYMDYRRLLERIKIICNVKDILEIEMRLYHFAEHFAVQYERKYNLQGNKNPKEGASS